MKSKSSLPTLLPSKAAIEVLRRHRVLQNEAHDLIGDAWHDIWNLIFPTIAGYPTHLHTMLKVFHCFLIAAKLPPTTRIHDLRHMFATLLLERGVHIKVSFRGSWAFVHYPHIGYLWACHREDAGYGYPRVGCLDSCCPDWHKYQVSGLK